MRIAYVMSRFPHLPETFILREMIALEALGHRVTPYPLVRQRQPVIHEDARPWLPRLRTAPLHSQEFIAANLRGLRAAPRELPALWRHMVGSLWRSPAFLARALYIFPRAVAAAQEMPAQGIQHIHAHYATHPALYAWLIHHLTGLSYSITVHAHDIFVNQTMLGPKLRDAAFIVAISDFNREFLTRQLGTWVRAKTHVVHCGIDPEQYRQASRSNSGERHPLEIISVGSLQPYKGHRHLIAALSLLRDRGIPFRCRIAGDGEERPRLERMLAAHALEEQVVLEGACTSAEVTALLADGNCYVQPSVRTASGKMEGIPVAIMEALASGLPVVASNLSGIPELVQPGKTGYLAPPADPAALADCLAHLYHHPAEAAARAEAGRALVAREFNLHSSARRLSALFATVRPEAQPTEQRQALLASQ